MRARCLQRPNSGEGPCVLQGKQKVSQGYSPADENAGLADALRDDDPKVIWKDAYCGVSKNTRVGPACTWLSAVTS